MDLLYEVKPNLVKIKSVIDTLGLPELLHEEVSLWKSLLSLSTAVSGGDVNSSIALAMLGGFALCLPVVDMFLLLFAACCSYWGHTGSTLDASMAASRVLRKLSMLDVATVGIALVVLALQNFRKKGVILSMQWGLLALLGAELCHYAMAFLVGYAHARMRAQACPNTSKAHIEV